MSSGGGGKGGGGGGKGGGGGAIGGLIGSLIGNQQAQSGRDEADKMAANAFAELTGIGLPPDLSKELILKQFALQGEITPELEEQINIGISRASQIQEDAGLKNAQTDALKSLQQRGRVGLTPEDRARLNEIKDESARDFQGKQQAILQQFQQRGQGGSGADLIAELQAAQGSANTASKQGDNLAAQASQNALQSITQAGNLAGNIRSQDFNVENSKAKAQDEFDRFNVQNQITQQQRNVASQNQAQASNLANKQAISNANTQMTNSEMNRANNAKQDYWNNLVKRAQVRSGAYQQRGDEFNSQADREAGQWAAGGRAIGTSADALFGRNNQSSGDKEQMFAGMTGSTDNGQMYGTADASNTMMASQGAVVPGKAKVPGNSPENDTVHYKLSPGEIVVPRTVAEKSPEEIAKFVQLMKPRNKKQ